RIVYATGLQALKAVQRQEKILQQTCNALNSSIDKLDKTAEKIVNELKEAKVENRKLLKELTAKESGVLTETTESNILNGINLIKRDFAQETDTNRMVQTATEIIKHNDATIALFFGADAKSAKIMLMSGNVAVEKGFNAGEVVKQTAPVFGGGGGGRNNFAQGGGTQPQKIQDAVKIAEEIIKKQLKA
ncbi:MAG: hypothetical protein GX638_18275, partial [Crenarchaeota archaeon]|nr:hypothetical protein [Thermoproteota archaeon]